MKTKCILSFTLSGHGFSGAVCIDGDINYATSLERITRIKNDILFPISKSDLKSFGWNDDPQRYVENIDLEFDLEIPQSDGTTAPVTEHYYCIVATKARPLDIK